VRLHITFLVLLVIQTLAALPGGSWYCLMWFLVLGPVLLVTVLIHELGHCLAARSVGGTAESILLWPLGGLAFISHNASPKKDIWVAAAGPLTHVPMIILWCLFSLAATHVAYGRSFVTLAVPYPDARRLGVAVCSMAIIMNLCVCSAV
jgi:Zn-dependent protease